MIDICKYGTGLICLAWMDRDGLAWVGGWVGMGGGEFEALWCFYVHIFILPGGVVGEIVRVNWT